MLTGLSHREFCIRLADSALLPWFLQIGRVDGVKCFSKSSSDRFAHLIDADSLQKLNIHLVALLGNDGESGLRPGASDSPERGILGQHLFKGSCSSSCRLGIVA